MRPQGLVHFRLRRGSMLCWKWIKIYYTVPGWAAYSPFESEIQQSVDASFPQRPDSQRYNPFNSNIWSRCLVARLLPRHPGSIQRSSKNLWGNFTRKAEKYPSNVWRLLLAPFYKNWDLQPSLPLAQCCSVLCVTSTYHANPISPELLGEEHPRLHPHPGVDVTTNIIFWGFHDTEQCAWISVNICPLLLKARFEIVCQFSKLERSHGMRKNLRYNRFWSYSVTNQFHSPTREIPQNLLRTNANSQ